MNEPTDRERRRWEREDRRRARRRAWRSRTHPVLSTTIGAICGAPIGVLAVHLISEAIR